MNEKLYKPAFGSGAKPVEIILAGITFPDPSYRILRPKSPLGCIEYVMRGKGHIRTSSGALEIGAGDTYFLHEGDDHEYGADRSDPWQKIWVNFSGTLIREMTEKFGLSDRIRFPSLDTGELLLRLINAVRENARDSERRCAACLTELFYVLSESAAEEKKTVSSAASAAKAYLDAHVREKVFLSDLGRAVSLSESQLSRVFQRAYGMSPYEYVLSSKIALAKDLLLSTSMTVREIAEYLGFSDEYYFSGVFRRRVGTPPGRFRKSR